MTAKSTGLGLPVRFQEWPSNGCSSAPGFAQRCWNLDKFQRLVSEDKLQRVMATLLRGSKWKDLRWHAWRRLGPATMYKAGGKIPSIKAWFKWRSTRTAMAYINCPHPGRIRHPFTTPTPPS